MSKDYMAWCVKLVTHCSPGNDSPWSQDRKSTTPNETRMRDKLAEARHIMYLNSEQLLLSSLIEIVNLKI